LQHLLTGHKELYDLFNNVLQSGKNSKDAYNSLFVIVKARTRKEAREVGIVENPTAAELKFAELDVVHHIIDEIDFSKWEGFIAKDDPNLGRIIKSDHRVFSLNHFDKDQAMVLALRLNEAVHDPDIVAELSKYHAIRKTRQENEGLFEERLGHLLRAIALAASFLYGACDHCIELQDQEDISRLKPMLAQIS
jgi:hypothetical protein